MAAEEVNITVTGDTAPLVAALSEGSAAFGDMAVSASASSDDIAASMAALTSVIEQLAAEMDVLAASMDNMAASATGASAATDETAASAAAASSDVMTLSGAVDVLSGAVDSLMGTLTPLIATFGTLIAVMGAMAIINDVSSWIQNLISQMFQLDQQTQKTVNSWRYLFATGPGGGVTAAQSLAEWAYTESPKLPFTAMDLRGAISTLGTAGYTAAQIEQFLPYLADIASTLGTAAYGGQGVTLAQAANAIRSAGFGLTRMLRTDLGISPAQLVPYGLDATVSSSGAVKIHDIKTLMPALEAFVTGRGLKGAAQEQETATFWGAWSSFLDYTQNFLQTMGGISPQTGQVEKGSMFGGLQNILISVNKMLGSAMGGGHGPLQELTGAVGSILGGGVSGITSFFSGVFGGGGAGGAGKVLQDLLDSLKKFGEWLQSSNTQAEIKKIGEAVGEFAGQVLKLAQDALPVMMEGLKMLAQSLQMLWDSLSPSQRQALASFVGDIFLVIGSIAGLIATLIAAVAKFNEFTNNIISTVQSWGRNLAAQFRQWGADFIQMLMQGIESKLGDLGGLLENKVGGLFQKILGHSGPTQGPMVGDDQWMVHMMMMFADGIQRGIPAVARASQMAAAAIGSPFHGAGGGTGGSAYGAGGTTNYNSSTNYGASSSSINMYGATGVMIEEIVLKLLQQNDRTANLKLGAPGSMYLFGMH